MIFTMRAAGGGHIGATSTMTTPRTTQTIQLPRLMTVLRSFVAGVLGHAVGVGVDHVGGRIGRRWDVAPRRRPGGPERGREPGRVDPDEPGPVVVPRVGDRRDPGPGEPRLR